MNKEQTILRVLNNVIEIFYSHVEESFEDVMSNGLRLVADLVGLDRIDINIKMKVHQGQFGQFYRWDRAVGGTAPIDEHFITMPNFPVVQQWHNTSLNGKCVIRRLDRMSEEEAEFAKSLNIKSVVIVPVITQGNTWGSIAFLDCSKERDFDEYEDLLYSVARLCSNAAIREEAQKENKKNFDKLEESRKNQETLNKIAITFISQNEESFAKRMGESIKLMCDLINLDRLSIFRNFSNPDGLHTSQIFRWDRTSGGITEPLVRLKDVKFSEMAPRWEKILEADDIANGPARLMPESEMLKSFGVVSVLVVPIFIKNRLWGFALFEDTRIERYFKDAHIEIMRSAAFLYVNMIVRSEMEAEIKKNLDKLKSNQRNLETLNKMSTAFVSQNDDSFDKKMTAGLSLICSLVGLDRVSIFRNSSMPDGLHVSQIYRWDKNAGGTTEPTSVLRDITYAKLAPRWEKLLENNEMANGPAKFMPEYDVLKSFGVVSALVMPIFIKDEFWGFALLEDRSRERYFEDIHVDIMRSAIFLCANIIIRAEMEAEIAEEVNFNETLLNAAPMSIAICDEFCNMLNCNVNASRMFGCSKQYFLEHFFDLSPEYQPDGMKSKDKIKMLMKNVMEKDRFKFDWMHSSSSGELIPCEISLEKMINKGKIIVLIYIYDLRNIKKMEIIVNEAQEMTRAIAEASPVSYILFNEDMQVVDCNETAVKTLKSPSKQYLINNYWNIFAADLQPDGQDSFKKSRMVLNKAFAEGKHSFEWVQRTVDGEDIPMENTLYPLVFKDKKFVISFKYDLRKQKMMVDDIRKQSELLTFRLEQQQFISEISKDFVSQGDSYTLINEVLNKLGRYLDISRIFIFYMDYDCGDTHAVYHWYADENTPKLRDKRDFNLFEIISSKFPKNLQEGSVQPISCSDVRVSSEKLFRLLNSGNTISFICVPLYVEGSLWGVISAEHCFSHYEWPEDETSFFSTVSSVIAGAIMRSIYDTKLKETLNRVINLSKAKDEFLSKISHEIRTPMNAIMGVTEIQLLDENLPHGIRDGLSVIHNSGDSLLRIINDLLDLSKIEAKKLEIITSKYEVASLISDSVQLNIARIESKPIEFELSVDENTPSELIGDELRVKQILNNILSNAFKYTMSGKVLMSVFSEKTESKDLDVMMVFKVSDTGQGMTDEQISKIFDEYSRFNMANNHKVEGTGLGMAITRNLVYLMNGTISVESKLGEGSVFTIRIPQKNAGVEILGAEMKDNLQKFRISSSLQMKLMKVVRDPMPYGKVLVVDDVESNLYVAKRLLAPYDLSLETATSGFEAIDKVNEGNIYDIIFMDHMMPKMDGIETVKILRDSGYTGTIIALTANAVTGQAEIFLQSGFDSFISKPINIVQLNSELNKFIRDKQSPEIIAEANKQKKEEKKYTQVMQQADATLHSIFARDVNKVIPVFESTLKNIATASEEDLQLFAIDAHAIKSALANIGEVTLSRLAFTLEKAGNEQDRNTISNKTQELVDALKKLVKYIEAKEKTKFVDKDENTGYLYEQLNVISNACENYNMGSLNTAIANLNKMQWTKETKNVLDKISEYILHSEFESAGALAKSYCENCKG